MKNLFEAELVNKFSKYIKTIGNRIVEVEFYWYQVNPRQNYRLRINEKQFNESQKYIRSKKLLNIKFEQFTELITPIFANEAAEISNSVLRFTFDCLFDQNSNGIVEQEEFDSLLILLQGINKSKQNVLHEKLRQLFGNRSNHISFKGKITQEEKEKQDFRLEFYDFVKRGYLRELLMS